MLQGAYTGMAKTILLIITFLTAGLLISSSPTAQEKSGWDSINCAGWQKTDLGLGQMGMTICASRDADAARKKLSQLLAELHSKFLTNAKKFPIIKNSEQAQVKRLTQSQNSWEQFVTQACEWESAFYEGGSMQPMVNSLCIADYTTDRIEHLRRFLCDDMRDCSRARAYAK
jgi:uncharacterized protein YecT (DUF1311 family)